MTTKEKPEGIFAGIEDAVRKAHGSDGKIVWQGSIYGHDPIWCYRIVRPSDVNPDSTCLIVEQHGVDALGNDRWTQIPMMEKGSPSIWETYHAVVCQALIDLSHVDEPS